MPLRSWSLAVSAVIATIATQRCAFGQANEIVMTRESAGSLRGVVIAPDGTRLEAVAVAECSHSFRDCKTMTHTNANGYFVVHSVRAGRTHYLKFLLPQMKETQMTVTLSSGRKFLWVGDQSRRM
jgi:hypothetical protein